jgi:hypothetical protein
MLKNETISENIQGGIPLGLFSNPVLFFGGTKPHLKA